MVEYKLILKFQFHKVRLKVIQHDKQINESLQFQFHKVRLKATKTISKRLN